MVCPIVKVGSSNNFSRDLNKLLSLIWFNLWRHSSALRESEKFAAIFVNTDSIFFSVSSAQISWKVIRLHYIRAIKSVSDYKSVHMQDADKK